MSSRAKLRPVPTPFAQRLRQARTSLLPALVLISALGIIGILWRQRFAVATFPHSAEPFMSQITSQPPFKLAGPGVVQPGFSSAPSEGPDAEGQSMTD